jgi:hypothetical protein
MYCSRIIWIKVFLVLLSVVSIVSLGYVMAAEPEPSGNVLAVDEDKTAPITVYDYEHDGKWVNSPVVVHLKAIDSESGVAKDYYAINGTVYEGDLINIEDEGIYAVYVWAVDNAGNSEEPQHFTIMLDHKSPVMSYCFQPNNINGWNNTSVTVVFNAYDALSGILSISDPVTITEESKNRDITGEAVDWAGNKTTVTVTVHLDRTPPEIVEIRPFNGAYTNNAQPKIVAVFKDNLSGVDPGSVKLTIDSVEITEGVRKTKAGLSYTPENALTNGSHLVVVTARDFAGNPAVSASSFFYIDPSLDMEEDTVDDPTDERRLYASVESNITGANPVQTDVILEIIVPERTAVIRGKVLDQDSQPLSGVAVFITERPEFGRTFSQGDGGFELVVNGGELLTVRYELTGYGYREQEVEVDWQDNIQMPDMVMTPTSKNKTSKPNA